MVNEAVIVELLGDEGDVIYFTVTDATGIEKGALLTLSDPRTAAAGTDGTICAGIAAAEKVALDGSTKLGCYTHGIFDLNASGAIAVGEAIALAGNNEVKLAPNDFSGAKVLGYALETAADNETIECFVRIGGGS